MPYPSKSFAGLENLVRLSLLDVNANSHSSMTNEATNTGQTIA